MKAFFVGRHRRNGELVLIIFGGIVTTGAYVLASVGRLSSIPANVGPFLAVVLGLFFVAHIATRFLAPEADGLLLPLAGLLNGLGYVFIARLDDDLAGQQALWTFLGVGLYTATLWFVRRSWDLERYRYTFLLIGLGLLVLPLLPVFGQTVNGSRIWVRVGPVNFQPSGNTPPRTIIRLSIPAARAASNSLIRAIRFRFRLDSCNIGAYPF